MDDWRICEELERMSMWDVDSLCDALNLTAEELLCIEEIEMKAIDWIRGNYE